MTTKGVFYFQFSMEFHEEVDEFVNKGFIFDFGTKPVIEFDGDDFCDITMEIESDYGVHDWGTGPSADCLAAGFHSYEVYRDQIPALMEDWRQEFLKMCDTVSPVVELDSIDGSDADIYKEVEKLL